MKGYKCEDCKQWYPGDATYTLVPLHRQMQWPDEWTFCSMGCVKMFAIKECEG